MSTNKPSAYKLFANSLFDEILLRKKAMNLLKITLGILFITQLFSWAQHTHAAESKTMEAGETASLSGSVVDAQSMKAVEFATIALYKLEDSSLVSGTITGENGIFSLEAPQKGKYYLEIQFVGYEKKIIQNIEITERRESLDLGVIFIAPSAVSLQGVEVVAQKNALEFQIDRQVINAASVTTAANGTALDLLRQSPSVTVDMNDVVYLRGSSDFLLLVNNKPVSGNPSEVLKQIPVSSIETIEIMTNPSSKYDSEGTSGIINVITLKNTQKESSGMIGIKGGTTGLAGGNGIFQKQIKFNSFTLAAGMDHQPINARLESERTILSEGTAYFNTSVADFQRGVQNPYVRIQDDIIFSPHFQAGIELTGSAFLMHRIISTDYSEIVNPNTLPIYSKTKDDFVLNGLSADFSVSIRQTFDTSSHYIETRYAVSSWDGINNEDISRYFTDSTLAITEFIEGRKFREDNWVNAHTLNVDYTRKKGNSDIEAGYQFFNRPSACYYTTTYTETGNDNWIIDDFYSGMHTHKQTRQAIYGNGNFNKNKWGIQAGIRIEDYYSQLLLPSRDESYTSQGLYVFPSLFFQYGNKEKSTWQFSYSKRVNYPNDWHISPNPFLNDGYLIQTGNPGLKPEFIHLFEINSVSYIRNKHTISAGLYARQINDKITRSTSILDEGKVVTTFVNFETSSFYGCELALNLALSKKTGIAFTANVFRQEGKSLLNSEISEFSATSFSLNTMINLQLKKGYRMQLSGVYNGPQYEGQYHISSMYFLNAAVRKELFQGKCSAVLQFNDVFNSMKYIARVNEDALTSEVLWDHHYPNISLGITYRFNGFRQMPQPSADPGNGAAPAI